MLWIRLLYLSIILHLIEAVSFINPAKIIPKQPGKCALEKQRNTAREMIQQKTINIIHDSVLPTLCNSGGYPDIPAASCDDIPKNCSSGWYWLMTPSGEIVKMYCDLERKCGCNSNDGEEAWLRVAHLDMTDPDEHCPEGLRMIESPKRSCRRSYQAFQTSIVPYRTYGYNYSHVCGRIIAYQYGITEGLAFINRQNNRNRSWRIDERLLDGIVVTHGKPGSRKHIWSFVAASSESSNGANSCSCTNNRSETVVNLSSPSVIGDSYFCDTGVQSGPVDNHLYGENPLWDGEGCGLYNSCCGFNNPPWFCKQLPEPTKDDIEVRLTATAFIEKLEAEDTPIEKIDIFIH